MRGIKIDHKDVKEAKKEAKKELNQAYREATVNLHACRCKKLACRNKFTVQASHAKCPECGWAAECKRI